MASWHLTFYGLRVELDHSEVNQVISVMNSASSGGHIVSGVLNHVSNNSDPAEHIAMVLSALIELGAMSLDNCNSNRNGIELNVTWRHGYWCLPL